MFIRRQNLVWAGAAALGLGCPDHGPTLTGDLTSPVSAPMTDDGGEATDDPATASAQPTTTDGPADTTVTTGEAPGTDSSTAPSDTTATTGTPPSGLVVTVTPNKPRSGSIAQLSATLDGAPVAVTWDLKSGPGKPALAGDGTFTVPQTPGTWKVEAALVDDPQQTATGDIVADFRGGRAVSGWGNKSGGLYLYDETYEDDWSGDITANADTVYGAIRRTELGSYTVLVGLDEATGDPKSGFGTNGLQTFTVAGKDKMETGQMALTEDRLWLAGSEGLDSTLAVASPATGKAFPGYGYYQPAHNVAFPTPDPTAARLYISTGTVDDWGIERLLDAGGVDTGWADQGELVPTIPTAWQDVWAPAEEDLDVRDLAVDASGRLLVLMRSRDIDSGGRVAALLRYASDASLDTDFGHEGATVWAIDDKAGTDPSAMAFGEDGSIVIVGDHYGRWFGTRLDPDGVPDANFGTNGNITHEYQRNISSPSETTGVDVEVIPGGYIVFLVEIEPGANGCGLIRYTPEGVVDTSFGDPEADGDGWSLLPTIPRAMARGSDGRVFVMGMDEAIQGMAVLRDVWINAVHSY